MTNWLNLLADDYKSLNFDERHARLDNYQVYSMAWNDEDVSTVRTKYYFGINLPPVPVLTSRTVSFTIRPNESRILSNPHNIITRGLTVRYYSKLTPGIPGESYSVLATIELQYRGDDDVDRTVARRLPEQTIVSFDPAGWTLDGEYSIPDTTILYEYQTVVDEHIVNNYTPEPDLSNRAGFSEQLPSYFDSKKHELCVAYQSFDVHGKILQDFSQFVEKYPLLSYGGKSNYSHLITGNPLDVRAMPDSASFVADTDAEINYSFYRWNKYETHPKISHTLDWVARKLQVTKGKTYVLRIKNIVLGTLLIDSISTKAKISDYTKAGQIPAKYLFRENIQSLIDYWDSLYPLKPPSDSRTADQFTMTEWYVYPADLIFQRDITSSTPVVRVMAANNDRWRHGGVVQNKNRPPDDHPIFQFDHQKLFETPQADGSYGTYMTDSPRIMEIHAALDAGTYAIDPETGGKRVANLGWMIEKVSNILGLRRKPNGKYLDKVDQAKYDRNRLNSPKWLQGDYDLNSWGNKGYALRHLPTSYTEGQRQDNQYDLVHDIPQLLAAVLDQIDLGQGLQHTAEIRLKVGNEVQSYSNVGQLMIDLAARVIELEAMMSKVAVMQIETANSVRELFPGIGIPVATKSVVIEVGGKRQQIFYPGFQSGKGSLLDSLSAIKVNIGIMLGQLMPQKKPDSRWNPFDRKPKVKN